MQITLDKITKENWARVASLSVYEDQRRFVADNAFSIAESHYHDPSVARAICADNEPVGFIMYESLDYIGRNGEYHIYRFMVDQRHQGSGIGKVAMEMTIREILNIHGAKRITICYVPANPLAKPFYSSLGFSEVGLDHHGEMIAEIRA